MIYDSGMDIPIKPSTPCVVAKINKKCNYPRIRSGGKSRARHVVEWEKVNSPKPAGMDIGHLCRNKACIRLDHLECVPARVNVLRGTGPTAQNARKTHCKHGHDLSGDNLRVDVRGWRSCRECQRIHVRNYDKRNGLTNHHRLLTPKGA